MERILCYIYKEMAEFEVIFALNLLGYNPELEISLIANNSNPVRSKAGITYVPDYTIRQAIELQDVEALIIPGGWSDEQSSELTALIKKLNNEEKLLAAICRGPSFLARAKVLGDAKYTTTYSEELVKKQNIKDPFNRDNYIKQNVVVDGHIITAVGSAFIDFAVEIIDYFDMFEDDNDKEDFRRQHKGLE